MITREYFKIKRASQITNINESALRAACNKGYLAHLRLNKTTLHIPDFEVYAIVRYKLEHRDKKFNWKDFVKWREGLTQFERL